MYDNRLDFMANNHVIFLRPKRSRTNNWANGSFRMTAQDVEDVIKYFGEEWKKALEYAVGGNAPTNTPPIDQTEKGKEKVSSKRKDPVEVPPEAQKNKDAQEVSPEAQEKNDIEEVPLDGQKRKKAKATKPTLETALTDDDYDQIVARLKEEMKDTF